MAAAPASPIRPHSHKHDLFHRPGASHGVCRVPGSSSHLPCHLPVCGNHRVQAGGKGHSMESPSSSQLVFMNHELLRDAGGGGSESLQ